MNPELSHTCCLCGHQWESLKYTTERGKTIPAAKVAKDIRTAVTVNKCGPYCDLCYYLIMAYRAARFRNANLIIAMQRVAGSGHA